MSSSQSSTKKLASNHAKREYKKTILQVLPSLISGGVERGTIEIAKKLSSLDYRSIVASSGGSMTQQLDAIDVRHIVLDLASKNPFVIIRNTQSLQRIIKEYNVDIVHARSRAPAWSCYMATKKNDHIKFITTFHGIYNISSILKEYYNGVMLKGEAVIAVSNFVKQHILQNYTIDEEKIVVINRGVDPYYFNQNNVNEELLLKTKEQYNIPTSVPVILLPGRMTQWKGQLVLVEALNKIRHLDFYCIIAGDLSKHPAFTQRIKNHILDLKLQSKIQIFGNEPNILGLYGISDIVLSASIEPEAFGRTIIEGQSMEKLVIATNIGGTAETISDGLTGYHAIAGDADDMAEKIKHCLSILRTAESIKITQQARKSVIDNFSLESMLNKTIDVYEKFI